MHRKYYEVSYRVREDPEIPDGIWLYLNLKIEQQGIAIAIAAAISEARGVTHSLVQQVTERYRIGGSKPTDQEFEVIWEKRE